MSRTTIEKKVIYNADISTLATGEELIAHPCVVWQITVVSDAAGDATINFSNTASAYSATYRILKLKTTDENQTVSVSFPEGLPCSSGLSASANKASVDVAIIFE